MLVLKCWRRPQQGTPVPSLRTDPGRDVNGVARGRHPGVRKPDAPACFRTSATCDVPFFSIRSAVCRYRAAGEGGWRWVVTSISMWRISMEKGWRSKRSPLRAVQLRLANGWFAGAIEPMGSGMGLHLHISSFLLLAQLVLLFHRLVVGLRMGRRRCENFTQTLLLWSYTYRLALLLLPLGLHLLALADERVLFGKRAGAKLRT